MAACINERDRLTTALKDAEGEIERLRRASELVCTEESIDDDWEVVRASALDRLREALTKPAHEGAEKTAPETDE